jgi:hypothetical protein
MIFDTQEQKNLFEAITKQTRAQTQSNLDNVSQTAAVLDKLLVEITNGTISEACKDNSCNSKE